MTQKNTNNLHKFIVKKPEPFIIKVTDKNKQKIIDHINEIRLTKTFFDDCAAISTKLRGKITVQSSAFTNNEAARAFFKDN